MIVVTAPTGDIGRQVLAMLLAGGEPIRVVARDPAKLPAEVRGRIEVVEGSHADGNVCRRAFEGADAVFWLVPGDPAAASAEAAYVDFARPGCDALRESDVKRVVGISALGRGWPGEAGHVTATLRMDDMIAETGVAYRALACASLMENILRQVAPIRDQGTFYWPASPNLRLPHVATRDVAAVAVKLLTDTSWSGVEEVPMLGPDDLSFEAMARTMADVLGKPVAVREMSMEDMRGMMTNRGASAGMAQAMVDMLTAKNEGLDGMVARGEADRERTPTTFRQWCETKLRPAVAG
ncbi:NAD(P)H-binding protein [Aureimonas leprariae]|uniref:NAD(P)H-binding protein n=1 Tax=Plantimonas leprariae TaxID=2615207 RepID=A0A7V7TUP0_9HYPH|nr:NAD(P)H-binding protein [Aureimonas leprariae]KAB0676311.1 NAD(P)H-binding protein [Aureimonas leprariae]